MECNRKVQWLKWSWSETSRAKTERSRKLRGLKRNKSATYGDQNRRKQEKGGGSENSARVSGLSCVGRWRNKRRNSDTLAALGSSSRWGSFVDEDDSDRSRIWGLDSVEGAVFVRDWGRSRAQLDWFGSSSWRRGQQRRRGRTRSGKLERPSEPQWAAKKKRERETNWEREGERDLASWGGGIAETGVGSREDKAMSFSARNRTWGGGDGTRAKISVGCESNRPWGARRGTCGIIVVIVGVHRSRDGADGVPVWNGNRSSPLFFDSDLVQRPPSRSLGFLDSPLKIHEEGDFFLKKKKKKKQEELGAFFSHPLCYVIFNEVSWNFMEKISEKGIIMSFKP